MRNILDSSGKHRSRFVTWMLVASSVAVPVVAVLAIHVLRNHIEQAHHAQIALAHILADSNELEAKEYETIARESLDANQSEEIEGYVTKVSLAINELIRLHPANPQLQEISRAYETYTRNMRVEFRLLKAGEIAAAKAQDEENVDAAFAVLHKLIEDADPAFSAAADRTAEVAEVGSAAITLFACVMMGLLFWRLRAVESVVIDQNLLRAANEKLRNEVAERKRVEENLRLQGAALEAAANAIVITDHKGNILWVNSAFTSLTGYTPEEVIGQNPRLLKSGKQDEKLYADLWKTVNFGQVWRGELINRRKDGTLYTEEMTITPVRNGDGDISRFIAIKQDVTARKLAEMALVESEHKYRGLVEQSADTILTTDDHWNVRFANTAACKMLGYTHEELLHLNVLDTYAETDRDAALRRRQEVEAKTGCVGAKATLRFERKVRRKDGTCFPAEVILGRIEDGRYQGIIRDISERKRVEEALHEMQRQQRALLDNIPDIAWVKDKESRYVAVNEAISKAYGRSPEEIIGKTDFDIVPADLAERYRADDKCVMESRERKRVEEPFEDATGHRTWIDTIKSPIINDQGEAIGTAGIARDISERKRMEESLRASEERYRGLFETMHEGFALCEIICDADGKPCDFRYLEVNSTFEEIGVKRSEVIGKTVREIFPQIEDYWIDSYGKVALTGTPAHFENYLKALDKHFEVAAFSPKPGQFAAMFMDISERKRAEQVLEETNKRLSNALTELKTAQEQTVQQERLRALGTMASGIAHDFNNSLTAILGYSELLLNWPEVLDDKEKARSYIEMMNTTAQDAGKIVNRLREFYRHRDEAEVFALVDIDQLVNEVIALTQPRWKAEAEAHGVSVDVRTDLSSVPLIAVNATNIREALTNLIFNAVDAMPHGGTITIGTRCHDDHVLLEVADTGTGMTEEIRRRCLEPFFTTKGEHGTGLGLSMVYGVVQRHEGTIDIQSEIGKGTSIIISLPHHALKPQISAGEGQPTNSVHSLRVLVVDDEPLVRKIIGEYLKLDGHVVELADDGRAGLEKFRGGGFDIVLVDRAMPDMSGDQVASAIKSVNPTVPVVMLTGFGAMMDAADEKPANVDLVIAKPITIAGLRVALAKVTAPGTHDPVISEVALATETAILP